MRNKSRTLFPQTIDEDCIPLKLYPNGEKLENWSNTYQNMNNNDNQSFQQQSNHETNNDSQESNDSQSSDTYGTFNAHLTIPSTNEERNNWLNESQPISHLKHSQSSLTIDKHKSKMNWNRSLKLINSRFSSTQPSTKHSIRTDKITGNRYRKMTSAKTNNSDINKIMKNNTKITKMIEYEKEVYNISSLVRNESLQNLYSRDLSQYKRMDHQMTDEMLTGYKWLERSSPWKEQLRNAATNVWQNQAIALLLLALLVTIVTFIISQLTLSTLHTTTHKYIQHTTYLVYRSFCWGVIGYVYGNNLLHPVLRFLGCLILKLGFVFTSIFLTLTAPQTAGSGIPQLKAILSGIWIRRYLSIRGFFIKSFALVCSLGSGLPIGIEGPAIHISAIIGRQLTKISMFNNIDRKMLLSAACACGIAVIFSAPIGGVLFSIEVTHHYYKIDNYWSAFLAAMFAALFTTIVQEIAPTTLILLHTQFTQKPFKTYEFVIFGVLGVLAGVFGAGYVKLHRYFWKLRRGRSWLSTVLFTRNGFWNNPYILAGTVTTIYVTLAYILGEFAFLPVRSAIADLFKAESLTNCGQTIDGTKLNCNFNDWNSNLGVLWNLFIFSALNYIFSVIFLVLDWPCGCFASLFAIGAASGRLLGEILNTSLLNWANTSVLTATYAVVGAASLVGGVTRTISVAVIVLEMTQSVQLSIPVLLGVILSWTVASWMSDSIYDSILNLRGIPLLPITPRNPINKKVHPARPFIAHDLMITLKDYGYLHSKSSLTDIVLTLEYSSDIFFAVVSVHTKVLIGEVSRQVLELYFSSKGYDKSSRSRAKLLEQAKYNRKVFVEREYDDNNGYIDVIELESTCSTNVDDDDDGGSGESGDGSVFINDAHFDDEQKEYKSGDKLCFKSKCKWSENEYEKINVEWIDFTDAEWIPQLNISPISVIPTMPIKQIYILFHVLRPDKIYVSKRNELVGVIDEQILIERERRVADGWDTEIVHEDITQHFRTGNVNVV